MIFRADYRTQSTHDKECEALFERFYHFGAHRSELSKPNDFRRIQAGGHNIVLYNDNGNIIAFENSCPHRGCSLITEAHGSKELLCPYHGWRFGERKCIVPNRKLFNEDEINSAALRTYTIDLCGNFIFFSPVPSATLREQLGSFWELLETVSHDVSHLIDDNGQPFSANWKISLENALENYHVSSVHPTSLGTLEPTDGTVTFDKTNSLWESPLGNTKVHTKLSKLHTLFDNKYRNECYFSLYLFPFSMISSTFGYSYAFQNFYPKTPTETAFSSRTYATQTEYTSFFDNVAQLNRQIFAEDARICQLVQMGTALGAPYIYNRQEKRILAFHQHYEALVKEEPL